jgi:DNA-directed RNA polymerase specialized sigma24 family protein
MGRPPNGTAGRCTVDDLRDLIASSAEEFCWLSYTLTGEHARAQISLENAVDQLLNGTHLVFREWINRWARRLIIKSCIVTMREEIQSSAQSVSKSSPFLAPPSSAVLALPEVPLQSLQTFLLRLDPLARFVVVLRMLEKYSRRETALLLGVDERACDLAQEAAMKELTVQCCPQEHVPIQPVTGLTRIASPGKIGKEPREWLKLRTSP